MNHGQTSDGDYLKVGFRTAAREPDGRPNPRSAIRILPHNHDPFRHLPPGGKTDDHQGPVDSMYRTSPSAHSVGFDHSSQRPSSCSSGTLDRPDPPFSRKGLPANVSGCPTGARATLANIQKNVPLSPASSTSSYDDPDSRSLNLPVTSNERDDWEKLAEQRSRIRTLLEDVRQKRSRHQDLQQQKDQADRELYLAVRRNLSQPDPAYLEKCVGASERATLLYQDAGARLHQVLEDLDDAELEVDILENRVYYRHIRGHPWSRFTGEDEDSDHDSQPPSRMSLRGISRDKSEDEHPLYQRMKDAFGELQLSREYLHNLTLKHSAVVSKDRSQLPQDTQDFLDSFDETTRKARDEIDHRMDVFECLKSTCQGRSLIPQTSIFYGDDNTAIPVLDKDISLYEDSEDDTSLAHRVYPILLSNPKHILQDPLPLTSKEALKMVISQPVSTPYRDRQIAEAMQEHGIGTLLQDVKPEDKNDFVNRWLLQKLRLSPMEALVLHCSCSTVLRVLDVDRWQRDVLQFWPRDGAVTGTSAEAGARGDPLEAASDRRTEPRSESVSRAVSAPERL